MSSFKAILTERYWGSWKAVIYIVVSLIVAAIAYISGIGDDTKTKVFSSVVIFFLSHIFVSQLFGDFFLDALRVDLHELKGSAERAAKEQALNSRVRNGYLKLKSMDIVIGATGQATADIMIDRMTITADRQKIAVAGRDFSYLCYSKFWEEICNFQRSENAPKQLVARMTHTSSIGSWHDEYYKYMSKQHKRFSDAGGVSLRVLIDRRPRASELSEYLPLMRKMKKDGVMVAYLNVSAGVPASALKADFCIVGDHQADSDSLVKYVLRWRLEQSEVKGLSLSQSRQKFELHESEWDMLESALERVDYSLDSSNAEQILELNAFKIAFLESVHRMHK